jgi:transcriptional regulator with XRE-family HTH domain
MTVHATNARLRELMEQYGLTQKNVSELLNGQYDGPSIKTINSWLNKNKAFSAYRKMPACWLYLLEIKIKKTRMRVRV